jgi:long-chain acyl-CoA synthetase
MGSQVFWRRAVSEPGWIAAIEPDGTAHTAGDLLARVNQLTHGLREMGLRPGDGLAVLAPNGIAALEVYLAALQSGWYLTPVNWHFTVPEIAYILRDSEAKVFVAHERFADAAAGAADEAGIPASGRISCGTVPGFTPVERVREGQSAGTPDGRTAGTTMHYTSGTTGRPKGVRRQLSGLDPDEAGELSSLLPQLFGITPGPPNVHLVTSPHYHTAVSVFGGASLMMGHRLVYMDGWDAERALALVAEHKVTSTHMVPTHFTRLLALPEETRRRYDITSMRWILHAAAPCPVGVKRAMLDWWGPRVYEYYAATEGGGTLATPEDWLAKPGTVGKPWPISEVMVAGKNGFFTVGDIGYLDEDGYLFLCDRKADMIISGGANIYPAEIEGEIIMHPQVADVAVFGIPDDEWGESVAAVVQPEAGVAPGPELSAGILASLDGRLARMKWPKRIDYIEQMPRDPSGKLLKRRLRDPYWRDRDKAI